MKRTLILSLPLLLLAACSSENPAPAGNADDLAPSAAAAAAVKTAAHLQAQRLHGQHWRLKDATTADGKRIDALFAQDAAPVTLDFDEGRLAVSNTCNGMSGGYSLNEGTLTFQPLAATRKACAAPLMARDEAVSSRLQGEVKADVADNGELTLRTAQGDVLVFQPEASAQTRYGGPGETVFLEVGPQTRPCPHPLIKDNQCLQVREVHFDDQGLKQGEPGEFENFYSAIEGYTHEAGVRNVLRVKRFKVENPPADGSSQAYVLDMVVESDTRQ